MNDSWYENGAKKASQVLLFQMKERLSDEEMKPVFSCISALTIWLWASKILKKETELDRQVLKALHDNFVETYDEDKAKRAMQMAVLAAQGMFEQVVMFNKSDADGQDWVARTDSMEDCPLYRKTLCELIKHLRTMV